MHTHYGCNETGRNNKVVVCRTACMNFLNPRKIIKQQVFKTLDIRQRGSVIPVGRGTSELSCRTASAHRPERACRRQGRGLPELRGLGRESEEAGEAGIRGREFLHREGTAICRDSPWRLQLNTHQSTHGMKLLMQERAPPERATEIIPLAKRVRNSSCSH